MQIITGAAEIKAWGDSHFNNPESLRRTKFNEGYPQAKYVYVDGGVVHAVEYDRNTELQHPQILEALGLQVSSLLLCGILTLPDKDMLFIKINTGTSKLFDQIVDTLPHHPEVVDQLSGQFQPYFPQGVRVNNTFKPFMSL